MSIKYYGPGDHPTGWIGFRVTVAFSNEYRQRYFTTRDRYITAQDDSCPWFKRQRLRAEVLNAEWEADSALYQYHRSVTQNHPTTSPFHGVGVHGITCQFRPDRRGRWQAGFAVHYIDDSLKCRPDRNSQGKVTRFYSFRTRSFSEVWRKVVNLWADCNDVLDVDRQRVIDNPPSPKQFTDLRRHLNRTTKADIPIEALRPVFAEQREKLKATRAVSQRGLSLAASSPEIHSNLAEEMAAWFETESS